MRAGRPGLQSGVEARLHSSVRASGRMHACEAASPLRPPVRGPWVHWGHEEAQQTPP